MVKYRLSINASTINIMTGIRFINFTSSLNDLGISYVFNKKENTNSYFSKCNGPCRLRLDEPKVNSKILFKFMKDRYEKINVL